MRAARPLYPVAMAASVFVDGRFAERGAARVSAFDAGFQHAVGLFETMLARTTPEGVVVERLEEHLDRLSASADELGLSRDVRTGPLAEAIVAAVERSGLERARVRLTITGGDLNLLEAGGRSQHQPTVVVAAQAATPYPAEMFERGVRVAVADAKANPLDPTAGHKTLNYWWRLRELQAAAGKGAGESIVLQVTNHLCGGCVSNVFIAKDGALRTPIARGEERSGGLPSPVLPGVTRRAVLDAARSQGIDCVPEMLSIDDLLDADEVFLTNSSWGVLPVVGVEASPIGDGAVGPLTRAVRAAVI